jgi:spermidine synthase
MTPVEQLMIIARAESVRGEVVLRRRSSAGAAVDELIVNGAFAMDSAETGSERELGRTATEAHSVLLGGLGLGYTADEVLASPVLRLDIVELEPTLIEWAKLGVTDVLLRVASDSRVRFHAGDIADVLGDRPRAEPADAIHHPSARPGPSNPAGPWDAILLDVDNGPDFLIHTQNANLYAGPLLAAAYRQLTPGGVLAIWCQGMEPSLDVALRRLGGTVDMRRLHTVRGARHLEYVIYTVRRGNSSGSRC